MTLIFEIIHNISLRIFHVNLVKVCGRLGNLHFLLRVCIIKGTLIWFLGFIQDYYNKHLTSFLRSNYGNIYWFLNLPYKME